MFCIIVQRIPSNGLSRVGNRSKAVLCLWIVEVLIFWMHRQLQSPLYNWVIASRLARCTVLRRCTENVGYTLFVDEAEQVRTCQSFTLRQHGGRSLMSMSEELGGHFIRRKTKFLKLISYGSSRQEVRFMIKTFIKQNLLANRGLTEKCPLLKRRGSPERILLLVRL